MEKATNSQSQKKKKDDRVEWRIWIIFEVYYSMLVKKGIF